MLIKWVLHVLWETYMDTHQYTVHVDQRGRLVLPVGIRHQLGIGVPSEFGI